MAATTQTVLEAVRRTQALAPVQLDLAVAVVVALVAILPNRHTLVVQAAQVRNTIHLQRLVLVVAVVVAVTAARPQA